MKSHFNYKFLLAPVLGIALSAPAIASAVPAKHQTHDQSMKVTISDLDLSKEEGIVTLYERLKHGANKVCGKYDTQVTGSRIQSLNIKKQYEKCSSDALNKAVRIINNKKLTDLHRKST